MDNTLDDLPSVKKSREQFQKKQWGNNPSIYIYIKPGTMPKKAMGKEKDT
jgi:hypothetical protein